jgi:hypothetical protein
MSKEEIDNMIKIQTSPVVKVFAYATVPVAFIIIFVVGALIYMLGVMMMGGKMNYGQALGVWIYSSLPPVVISIILNIILVFIKSPDSYDIVAASRRGLVQANLGILVNAKASPALYTLLANFDVFVFYGLFLAALGLRVVGRISSGLAWTIVIGLWVLGVAIQILFAVIGAGR